LAVGNKKGAMQGKIFLPSKNNLSNPAPSHLKADIVSLKRWHKKITMAKIRKMALWITNQIK